MLVNLAVIKKICIKETCQLIQLQQKKHIQLIQLCITNLVIMDNLQQNLKFHQSLQQLFNMSKAKPQSESEEYDSQIQRQLQEFDQEQGSYEQDSDDVSDQQQQNQGNGQQQQGQQQQQEDEQQGGKKKKGKQDQDQQEKRDFYREHLNPDEEVEANAPFTVVVQGSKQSGKSSLIRSLIKHFTKYKVDDVNGTITLRANKKQRITIIQCPTDICSMIDLAKIADMVVLMIDASLGFEMETFEFLSLLKSHGFPHVLGALTHLDFFKQNKQLKKTNRKFKKRFEYQVGGNYKLFNLGKFDNGVYQKIQVAKLARHIGSCKPPEIPWRLNHPYIMADRWQTLQDKGYTREDDVDISFYGYVRGSSYRMNGKIHIVGVGDYMIKQIKTIADPCPQYKKQDKKQKQMPKTKGDMEHQDNQQDQDQDQAEQMKPTAAPIKRKRRTLNQQERIIYAPACNLGTMNLDHTSGYITIPKEYVKFTKMEGEQEGNLQEGIQIVRNMQSLKQSMNDKLRQRQNDFELFQGVKMQGNVEVKQEDNQNQAKRSFKQKRQQIQQLKKQTQKIELVNPYADGQDVHRKDDLQTLIYESKQKMRTNDCSKYHPQGQYSQNLKSLFVTGMDQDVLKQLQEQEQNSEQDKTEKRIKKVLNTDYIRATIGLGTNMFQKGQYVCITLQKVKYGLYLKFTHKNPMILTRTNLGQDNFGFLNVKFKRHRWYSNLLKSNDPIIVSSGWRRYQSMIVFATQDQNQRMRFLKYTPKHDFCNAVFYGNFVQQNSGVVLTQTVRNDLKKFRIAGTGLVTQINKSYEVMKKIKLVGQPYKIMKNTAFVKGMFNSSMEVANYIGAQIRTVSGIRGQIKKIIKQGGQGTYRATFQDKIVMSDIIFCRAWYKIILERYYNPIVTYDKKRLMKTKYELRMENGVQVQKNPDSQYKTIDRAPKVFNPFMLPKKLEAKLPFKTSQKIKESKKQRIRRAESQKVPKLLSTDKERQVAALIQRLNTIKNEKQEKKQQKLKEKIRIIQARQKPKQEYYDKLKKQQKSEKMANIMRKKHKEERNRDRKQD